MYISDFCLQPADIQMFPNFTALPEASPPNCTNVRHTSGSQWTTMHRALIPLAVFILSLSLLWGDNRSTSEQRLNRTRIIPPPPPCTFWCNCKLVPRLIYFSNLTNQQDAFASNSSLYFPVSLLWPFRRNFWKNFRIIYAINIINAKPIVNIFISHYY